MAGKNLKWKRRKYSKHRQYLNLGLITPPTNAMMTKYLIYERLFKIDTMKPAKMKNHIHRIHPDKKVFNFFEL